MENQNSVTRFCIDKFKQHFSAKINFNMYVVSNLFQNLNFQELFFFKALNANTNIYYVFPLKKNSLSELSIYVSGKFRSLETVIRSIQTFKNESLLKGNRGLKFKSEKIEVEVKNIKAEGVLIRKKSIAC